MNEMFFRKLLQNKVTTTLILILSLILTRETLRYGEIELLLRMEKLKTLIKKLNYYKHKKLNQILKSVRMFQRKLNLLTLVEGLFRRYAKILFQKFLNMIAQIPTISSRIEQEIFLPQKFIISGIERLFF